MKRDLEDHSTVSQLAKGLKIPDASKLTLDDDRVVIDGFVLDVRDDGESTLRGVDAPPEAEGEITLETRPKTRTAGATGGGRPRL